MTIVDSIDFSIKLILNEQKDQPFTKSNVIFKMSRKIEYLQCHNNIKTTLNFQMDLNYAKQRLGGTAVTL